MMIKMYSVVFVPLSLVVLCALKMERARMYTDQRDNEVYQLVELNDLVWFRENLRYQFDSKSDTVIDSTDCGVFYSVQSAKSACPEGWRLPTEKEVKKLIRLDDKGKISLVDTLQITLCGRIDNNNYAKIGLQNTFWLEEELKAGYITHWHTFKEAHKTHNHNVVVAQRKFPIRCVCEIK